MTDARRIVRWTGRRYSTSAHALAWLPASASTPAWRANRLMAAQLARCAPAGWVRLAVSPLALCSARRLAGARAAPVRVAGPPPGQEIWAATNCKRLAHGPKKRLVDFYLTVQALARFFLGLSETTANQTS